MSESSARIRVLIGDDDPIVRQLVRKILVQHGGVEVLGEAVDGDETLRLVQDLRPDVLLLDLLMPRLQGMQALHAIATGVVPVRVVILAASITNLQALEALQLGAHGLLPKKAVRKLPECINCVAKGEYWAEEHSFRTLQEAVLFIMGHWESTPAVKPWNITPREMQVMSLLVLGKTNREIAVTLSISEQTVKHHLLNIFDKCDVANRTELVRFASRHGLFENATAPQAEFVSAPSSPR